MTAAKPISTHGARLERLDALAAKEGLVLEQDVPLAPLTTLRVGGPADRLVLVRTRASLVMILKAWVTFSVVAPPPTSRKLAGMPP